MSNISFENAIDKIVNALKSAGYDPYSQLYAYISTGNATYITRKDNARELIRSLDKNEIRAYIEDRREKVDF